MDCSRVNFTLHFYCTQCIEKYTGKTIHIIWHILTLPSFLVVNFMLPSCRSKIQSLSKPVLGQCEYSFAIPPHVPQKKSQAVPVLKHQGMKTHRGVKLKPNMRWEGSTSHSGYFAPNKNSLSPQTSNEHKTGELCSDYWQGQETFFLLQNIWTTFHAYPVSYSVGTRGSFTKHREAKVWTWPLTLTKCRG